MKLKTVQKLSKTFGIIAIATILIGTSFTSTQTASAAFPVIDFDSLAGDTLVTTQFQAQGAHFSSFGGGPAKILVDVLEATSLPNILVGNGGVGGNQDPIWITIVDAAGNLAATDEIDLEVISVGDSTVTVTSKDKGGNTIDTQTVGPNFPGFGQCNGLANQDFVNISGVGAIATVHITIAQGINCADGVGIDDVIIGDLVEGCSPGFYKNDAKKFGATQWTTYDPTTEFESGVGGVFDDIDTLKGKGNSDDAEPNLLEALNTRGSDHNALAREAVAALLNSQVGSGVDYPLTEAQVKTLVNNALGGSAQDIEDARAFLWSLNHAGCPLLHGPKV